MVPTSIRSVEHGKIKKKIGAGGTVGKDVVLLAKKQTPLIGHQFYRG